MSIFGHSRYPFFPGKSFSEAASARIAQPKYMTFQSWSPFQQCDIEGQ
jgi:hypothetical protein